ncbi:MAG: DNA (cytosine-5-)-methyltransferase [Microbacterium sp.]
MLSISAAATTFDVSIDTIRRWEKKGLLKSTRNGKNQREFASVDIAMLMRKLSGRDTENRYRVLTADRTDFTAIDLFAGGGGTALGLDNAGFSHLAVNEFDRWAAETLRRNRPDWNVIEGDVRQLDFSEFAGRVDLLEGGFPCQAFSYAGKKKGFADTRGTLFHEFARAVEETRPKIAVGENVRGLLTHDGGRTLRTMTTRLQSLGYRVAHRILRAQYLDTPQKRERLILIAVREDIEAPILFPKEQNYTLTLRDAIGDRPVSEGAKYADWKREVMDLVPQGGYWRDLPDEVQRSYMKASYFHTGGKTGMARRLHWDEPALTLTCNPAQKQTERCHPDETRPLNVREYARIQTFPDTWEFAGGPTQQYKQIGNAVPVNLGFHLGMAVRAMLGDGDREGFEVVEPLEIVTE